MKFQSPTEQMIRFHLAVGFYGIFSDVSISYGAMIRFHPGGHHASNAIWSFNLLRSNDSFPLRVPGRCSTIAYVSISYGANDSFPRIGFIAGIAGIEFQSPTEQMIRFHLRRVRLSNTCIRFQSPTEQIIRFHNVVLGAAQAYFPVSISYGANDSFPPWQRKPGYKDNNVSISYGANDSFPRLRRIYRN